MRPEKSDLKYIWDMLDAARTIVSMCAGLTLDDYENTKPLRLSVERAVEIIGEAARHVSDEFKTQHPAVPWSAIIATRHILAHEYDDIRSDKMWRIVTIFVPALIEELAPIIEQNPPNAGGPNKA